MNTHPIFTKLDFPEKTRSYIYGDGSELEITNVTALAVSTSGTHRLETADGEKYIVAPGWIAIRLDVPQWTL